MRPWNASPSTCAPKYAAGGLEFDHPGFSHTVLVDMRARLAGSEHPERIFEVAHQAARGAGLVGRRRALDSTALYDAVATMDTVTLLRSGIRGLLRRADDYTGSGKPVCDWEDPTAREALIEALARDAGALLAALDPDGETVTAVAVTPVPACAACPLASRCITAKAGRSIAVGPHEAALARARSARHDSAWQADYRATRPKVERSIAYLVPRRHGGHAGRLKPIIQLSTKPRALHPRGPPWCPASVRPRCSLVRWAQHQLIIDFVLRS